MKFLVALAFLAVASAAPRPDVQPIRLMAPAAPEVEEVAMPFVDVPLEDAQDPASNFEYGPVDNVNAFDGANDQAPWMIDISPAFVSEDVMRAVREAAVADAEIQPVQLPEPAMPETFEAPVFDVSKLTFVPVAAEPNNDEVYETSVDAVNVVDEVNVVNALINELSFEPVAVEPTNEIYEAPVSAVNDVDAPIKELSFEPVAVEAKNEEVYETPVDIVNVVDAPINELSFEPVAVETNNEEIYETPVNVDNVVDAPINKLSFEPVAVEANNEEVYETPIDAVNVVDIAADNFLQIAPSELEAIRIAPWQVEDIPQDFIPQAYFPIRYPNPYWR